MDGPGTDNSDCGTGALWIDTRSVDTLWIDTLWVVDTLWVDNRSVGVDTGAMWVDNPEVNHEVGNFSLCYITFWQIFIIIFTTSHLSCHLYNVMEVKILLYIILFTFKLSIANTYIGILLFFPAMAEAVHLKKMKVKELTGTCCCHQTAARS